MSPPSPPSCTACGQPHLGDGVQGVCPRCLGSLAVSSHGIPLCVGQEKSGGSAGADSEIVLWQGRPVAWRAALRAWPWLGIAIPLLFAWWSMSLESRTAPDPAASRWILVFGLSAVSAPVLTGCIAWRTRYVLTNRRAIIRQPWIVAFARIESFSRADFGRAEIVRGRRGNGQVIFARHGPGGTIGFKDVAQVAVVEALVRQLANDTEPRTA